MNTTEELKGKLRDIKHQLYLEKRTRHHSFIAEHKFIFKVFDTLFVLSLLCNFGALMLTDILTSKSNYETAKEHNTTVVYQEANPADKYINNFTPESQITPERKKELTDYFKLFWKQSFLWFILFGLYAYQRITISNKFELAMFILFLGFFFYLIVGDFVHDLGLYVGMIKYG